MVRHPSVHQTSFGSSPVHIDLRNFKDRRAIDLLIDRCHALPPQDCQVLLAVFQQGLTIKQIAAVQGRDVKLLRLRVRSLVRRVLSESFIYVLRNRDGWTDPLAAVGNAVFIRGLTLRQAARELKLTYHVVRRHRDAIRAMVASQQARDRRNQSARRDPGNRGIDLQGAA